MSTYICHRSAEEKNEKNAQLAQSGLAVEVSKMTRLVG